MKIALIGNGAIAQAVSKHCLKSRGRLSISTALGLPEDVNSVGDHSLTHDLEQLLTEQPDLVVECASQDAVRQHGVRVLEAGVDLMVISVGAFAMPDLADLLEKAADAGGARVIIPAGALAGLDALGAASCDEIESVSLITRKPPMAWSGAPGVDGIALDEIRSPTTIFSGSARDATQAFPKNANVAAALGLAGIGTDRTQVNLIADPDAVRNSHAVQADGAFGRLSVTVEAEPSPDNPKTSYLAALSIIKMLDRLSDTVVL